MIAYLNDFKLLMVLTLAVIPLVLVIGYRATRGGRRWQSTRRRWSEAALRSCPRKRDPGFCVWIIGSGSLLRGDERRKILSGLSVCSPSAGIARSRVSPGSAPAPAYETGPLGVSTVIRRRCGCVDSSAEVVDARKGDVGGFELLHQRLDIHAWRTRPRPRHRSRRDWLDAFGLVANFRSVPSAASPSTFSASMRHSRSFWIEIRMSAPSRVLNTP